MRKNSLNRPFVYSFFRIAAFSVFLFSCKTTKTTVGDTGPVTLKTEAAADLYEKVLSHQYQYPWLTAKASVEYTDHNNEQTSFTVTMRAARDSAIWISVSPLLGIEAARVLMTRDSIRLMDRVHQTSITRDYRFLEDLLKTKVTFEMVQALLSANYFSGTEQEQVQSVYEESPYYILSTLPKLQMLRIQEEKNPEHPVVQDFWIDTAYRIVKTRIDDDRVHRSLTIDYNDFIPVNDKFFPRSILLSIAAEKPARISIVYSRVSFEGPLSFPFSVPEKYSRE